MPRASLIRSLELTMVACFVFGNCDVAASQYKWHRVVAADGQTLAEYTLICTYPDEVPMVCRILYLDDTGQRLVIRDNIGADGVGTTSIARVGSAEKLTIHFSEEGNINVSFGSSSMTFHEDDEGTAALRVQGNQLLALATQSFKTSLQRLATVGSYRAARFASIARMFRAIFYENIAGTGLGDNEGDYVDFVRPFDPNTTPPGSFEEPFGAAYYE